MPSHLRLVALLLFEVQVYPMHLACPHHFGIRTRDCALAELDYLVGRRVGRPAQLALLGEVARGAYQLELFSESDIREARAVMERYADLDLGLADASVVVLADRYGTQDLLCTDQKRFRVVRGRSDAPFRLLPYDA